jgi:hypothetical protein
MAQFAFSRLRPILDFGKQFWLNPDAALRDALAVRLRLADQRCEASAQGLRALGVEAMVDLAGIYQFATLSAANVKPIPLVTVERETGDRQRLSLRTGLLAQSLPRPEL